EVASEQTHVGPPAAPAVADLAGRRGARLRVDAQGRDRLEARQREAGRGRQEDEVACLQGAGLLALDGQQAAAFEHCAEARLRELGVPHAPAAGAADALGEHGARLEEGDDLRQRVAHVWTMANQMWTLHCRKSEDQGLSLLHRNQPSMKHMKTVLITGCSSGYGLETARRFLGQGWQVVATMRAPRQ